MRSSSDPVELDRIECSPRTVRLEVGRDGRGGSGQPDPELAVRAPRGPFRDRPEWPDWQRPARSPAERVVHPRAGIEEGPDGRRPRRPRLRRDGGAPGAEPPDQRHPPRGGTVADPPVPGGHPLLPEALAVLGGAGRAGPVLPAGG